MRLLDLRTALAFLLVALCCLGAEAQRIRKMEFRDQPIADILLSLARASGRSIVADETVSGKASFYFAEAEFDEALASFLSAYGLYSIDEGQARFVSRVYASYDRSRDSLTMRAEEADVQVLVKRLSKAIGKTVVCDSLPRAQLSVDIESVAPGKALEILLRRFPEYRIEADSDYFLVRRVPQSALPPSAEAAGQAGRTEIRREGELFSLALEKGNFLDTLCDLFAAAGKEYSILAKSDAQLEDLYFSNRDFDSLLRLVLEQGNADYKVEGGVYRIFEIQRRDVVKGLRETSMVRLKHLTTQDLLSMLPGDLASGAIVKADKEGNAILVTGSPEEADPVLAFIAQVDRPLEGRSYRRFDMRYAKAKDIVPLLPSRLAPSAPVILPDGTAFVALLSSEEAEALRAFIDAVDTAREGPAITLRYIRSDELMKCLPPSISKDDIVESGLPSVVFFVGSEEKRSLFLREKEVIDRPRPQIRYELLVIQRQDGSGLDWSRAASVSGAEGASGFSANLSELLGFNFDVVSQFGLLFSAQLSLELRSSLARVCADTTLSALSGQEVKFQNTGTYRYAEASYDAEAKKFLYSGATKEISSGLILQINGWVSGDRMITMCVNATISKQGASSGAERSSLPPTTEKVVSTQVRTPSGLPVVIGGLKQEDRSVSESKVPLLGDIPLLGRLFRNRSETREETEFVVYIVPRLSYGEDSDSRSAGRAMEDYYYSYVKGFAK